MKLAEGENRWAFICCNVGHSKVFCIRKETKEVIDVTQNNFLYRMTTPQGRLGPCVEGTFPDLSNLRLYFFNCQPGDIFIMASPGAHANFHPQQQGKEPWSLRLAVTDWKELQSSEKGRETLNDFVCSEVRKIVGGKEDLPVSKQLQRLAQAVIESTESTRSNVAVEGTQDGCSAILDHCTFFGLVVETLQSVRVDAREDLSAPIVRTNRQWHWRAFIPKRENPEQPLFDLFQFLLKANPSVSHFL